MRRFEEIWEEDLRGFRKVQRFEEVRGGKGLDLVRRRSRPNVVVGRFALGVARARRKVKLFVVKLKSKADCLMLDKKQYIL